MGGENETEEEPAILEEAPRPSTPGLLVVVENDRAVFRAHAIAASRCIVGRGTAASLVVDDNKWSRQHLEVRHEGGIWTITDLGSQNGTVVDGALLQAPHVARDVRTIRAGRSIVLPVHDVAPFAAGVEVAAERITGPAMRSVLRIVDDAAHRGDTLLVLGETGTGKEYVAQRYFAQSGVRGPFVARNAAAIPASIAESLLFGAKRGAFSGADRDQEGLFVAAHGGVLFLDEVGDLSLEVQTKLLRVLETREVVPLGASRGQHVDVRLVTATRRNLDELVARGSFGADVRERLARRVVRLPSLCERLEEIPFLVEAFVRRALGDLFPIHVRLFETCLLAEWTDRNIRGLQNAIDQAAKDAHVAGATELRPEHLRPDVRPVKPSPSTSVAPPAPVRVPNEPVVTRPASPQELKLAQLLQAYERHRRVSAAAKEVGMSRQHAYVLLRQAGVQFRPGAEND